MIKRISRENYWLYKILSIQVIERLGKEKQKNIVLTNGIDIGSHDDLIRTECQKRKKELGRINIDDIEWTGNKRVIEIWVKKIQKMETKSKN